LKRISFLVKLVALAMVFYQMISTQVLLLPTVPHLNTHLFFALLLIFLSGVAEGKSKAKSISSLIFAILTLFATGYIHIYWKELQMRAYFNTPIDLVIGVVLIFLTLEATRRSIGLFLPLLILGITIYPFIGHFLPEPFYCHSLGIARTISKQSMALESGLFQFLSISTNYIFLFILLGGLLQAVGGTSFFMEVSKLIVGRIRGGPAMMAVVSSAMVGMITGSAAANVAITGTFTIPLMKRIGYKPEHAAAIEAAASNGGQIMPPIMGMVAFAMAGITGIPYVDICIMAIIPAILYFFNCGTYVYFQTGKLNIGKIKESAEVKGLVFSSMPFIVPITIIIVLLIKGYSVMYVAFWAIIGLILIAIIQKKSAAEIFNGLTEGAKAGAGIAASVAAVGLIATTFITSGLGVKIASGIVTWSGGNLFLGLLIIWGVCILLGLVGLSLTAYLIVVIFGVSPLVKMGIPPEIAHFFVMYVSVFAFLTPPVAVVALIAARMAGASYLRTAIESTKVALAGFLLPFLFIYSPVLLLKPKHSFWEMIEVLAIILILSTSQIGLVGYFLKKCSYLERILSIISTLSFLFYLVEKSFLFFITGIIFLGALIFFGRNKENGLDNI